MPILRGLNPERVHHIAILRDVQAMPTDEACCLLVHGLRADGEFLPLAQKQLRLEVIGDSITSAEGAIGAKSEEDWIAPLFCAARGYPFLLAKALDADLRVLSQSGWGALTSWDNDPHCALPLYYEQVCGVLMGEKNRALGAFAPNDFSAWSADVVVVNLGTNDGSAFRQPPWVDPETGRSYQQRTNPDGTRNAEDEEKLRLAIRSFLRTLRRCNPNAHLLWAYGMLGAPLEDLIRGAVETYAREEGACARALLPAAHGSRGRHGRAESSRPGHARARGPGAGRAHPRTVIPGAHICEIRKGQSSLPYSLCSGAPLWENGQPQ